MLVVTIPLRSGATRPASRPGTPDPLAPLLDLPGVRAAADAARAGIDRLLGHKVLRRESAGVSTESALRGARASAALEGVDVPLADLRAGNVDDPLVQGALRVSAGLGSMVETWSRAPGQVLARLHVLAAADLVDAGELGRPAPHAGPRLSGLFTLVTGPDVRAGGPDRRPGARRAGRHGAVRHRRRCRRPGRREADRHHARTGPEGGVGPRGGVRRAGPGRVLSTRWTATRRGRRPGSPAGSCTAAGRPSTGRWRVWRSARACSAADVSAAAGGSRPPQ